MRAVRSSRFALVCALALLVSAVPVQASEPASEASDDPSHGSAASGGDLAEQVLGLGALEGDAFSFAAHELLDARPNGPGLARYAIVPESIYRGALATCDMDGDGVHDLITNDMQLRQNGRFDSGFSTVRALSGQDGHELWEEPNALYYNIALDNAYSAFRPGTPNPASPPNMIPVVDVNGDGTCDVLAYGFSGEPLYSTPILGSPSVTLVDVTIRALSGKDGATLWSQVVTATDVDASDPFYPIEQSRIIRNFPTGFAFVQAPDGPRLVVKTTDLLYLWAADPFEVTAPLVDGDAVWYSTVATGEHIQLTDVTNGQNLWVRDFPLSPDADNVNVTWVAGLDDVTGDGQPDVVLDQFTLSNPRGAQFTNPTTGEAMYRHGRGMRVLALDGTDGTDLWSTIILDPLAVQTPPQTEENVELLAWTFGFIPGDINGDGKADPFAQYLGEEMVGGTPNGRSRTHFIPLDGATGAPLWEYKQQGWGFATLLGEGRVGAATFDRPEGNMAGGRPPEKALRIAGIDAATGNPLWSYEAPFGQDSQSSYEIGLQQVRTSLAPADLDGDGIREVITPSRYVQPEGRNQVFLATARQTYQVLDGASGAVENTLESWGSSALLLPCTVDGELTFVVGHARRLDLVRIDAVTGETLMRRSIWNFVEARASVAGIDLMGLAGACSIVDGRLTYGVNMEAFSFYRRYEIVPLLGVMETEGGALWRNPEIQPDGMEPPTPSLLETLAHPEPLVPHGTPLVALTMAAALAGVAAGGMLGIPAGRWLSRRRRQFDPLGLAMMLLVLPGAGLSGLFGGEGASDAGTATDPLGGAPWDEDPANALAPDSMVDDERAVAADVTQADLEWPAPFRLTAAEEVARWSRIQAGLGPAPGAGTDPDVSQHFDENDTLTFTHLLSDEDGDGVQDIALDVYCTDGASCYEYYPGLTQPAEYLQRSMQQEKCGPYHSLVVISGARGDRLWDEPLDRPVSTPVVSMGGFTTSCGAEAVVGIVPLPTGGSGILLYRYESVDVELGMTGKMYNHTIFLREGATGQVLWSFNEVGYMTPTYLNSYEGLTVNNYLNPSLILPDTDRIADRSSGAELGLFIQGHGFRFGNPPTIGAPGLDHGPRAEDAYDPIEWLARLDPVTGEVLWRKDSFQPAGHSIIPFPSKDSLFRDQYFAAEFHEAYDYPYPMPAAVPVNTWGDVLCCGDLTGDGVFDPTFRTLEWTSTPNANAQIHRFSTYLVVFDGATGDRLYTVPIFTDIDGELAPNRRPFWRYPFDAIRIDMKAIGDADGDGDADLMLRSELVHSDYGMDIRVIEGDTGKTLWGEQFPRAQLVLTIGDADGDGGNDLLFADWFKLERTRQINGDQTNVTKTPLKLRSGVDGHVIYETFTINSPLDIQHIYGTLARNGVPDLDLDGVGDFPIDDPIYLPDQVTLHQLRFLSGKDASRLFDVPVAGAFAFPSALPDLDGDGRPELAILSGDPNDLWLSYRDGKDGSALWGHRALPIKTSSFALTVPKLQVLPMVTGFGEHDVGFVMNMHMDVEAVLGEYETIYIDGSGTTPVRQLYINTITLPQLTVVLDKEGWTGWSYPSQGSVALSRLDGESPGTAAVLAIRKLAEPSPADATVRILHDTRIPLMAFAAGLGGALVAVAVVLRRREVPL